MTKATTKADIPDSVSRHFAECELDDAKPFPSWLPSPEQIAAWSARIREEREFERLDESTNLKTIFDS